MNKKVKFALLCVLLAVLIAGAVVFYNRFSQSFSADNKLTVVNDGGSAEDIHDKSNVGEDVSEKAGENDNTSPETESKTDENVTDDSGTREQTNEALAPDVEFFDVNGESKMLSDFFDKPVVLNFWATWCGPCKSEMPGFDNLFKKYGDRVNFLMLNVSDDQATVSDFLSENGYGFPVYFDKTQAASYTYGASSIPLTFVIFEGGEVYGYQIGVLPEEALEEAIKTVLGEE